MAEAALGCVVPYPIPGLVFRDVFVMTTLHGYKVTDPLALSLLSGGERDRSALLSRIAHASAHQLLVAGLFNGMAWIVGDKFDDNGYCNENACFTQLILIQAM